MKKTKKGFTLVELVIVVAVMAVLVAVAIPTVSAITGTAKESVKKTNAQTIESILKLELAEQEVDNAGVTGSADSLTADEAKDAIIAAKLGITEGVYYYNVTTGVCDTSSTKDGTEVEYVITFSGSNDPTVNTVS